MDTYIEDEETLMKELAHNELIIDFKRLRMKAQKRAIEDKLTQYYKRLIDEEMFEDFDPAAQTVLKTLKDLKGKAENIEDSKNGKHTHCFFTINVKPERGSENHLEDFENECRQFFESCTYTKTNYIYSIEQRSDGDEDMHGLHCHVLFDKSQNSPSKIQRAFKNKFFDKWVGTPAALDYRYGSGDKFITEKTEYIKGNKNKEKMPKVHKDRILKTAHGLPWWVRRDTEGLYLEIGKK